MTIGIPSDEVFVRRRWQIFVVRRRNFPILTFWKPLWFLMESIREIPNVPDVDLLGVEFDSRGAESKFVATVCGGSKVSPQVS